MSTSFDQNSRDNIKIANQIEAIGNWNDLIFGIFSFSKIPFFQTVGMRSIQKCTFYIG